MCNALLPGSEHESCRLAYQAIATQYQALSRKTKGIESIHEDLKDKDDRIRELEEKVENYKHILALDETRGVNRLRYRSRGEQTIKPQFRLDRNPEESYISQVSDDQDLEEDGCSSSVQVAHDLVYANTAMSPHCELRQDRKSLPLHSETIDSQVHETKQPQSFPVTSFSLQASSTAEEKPLLPFHSSMGVSDAARNGVSEAERQRSSVHGERYYSGSSDVSKELVTKLLNQNGRLKKAMRDILQFKGMTVTDYLVISSAVLCFF